jgi:NADPH:quinone reductase-like Zn-dependent oxidoreductase
MLSALVRQPGKTILEIVERDIPRPGTGEVLVNLKYATLNYRDLLTVTGGYGSEQKRSDLVPLSDASGIVAEVGTGVPDFRPGDRVVP